MIALKHWDVQEQPRFVNSESDRNEITQCLIPLANTSVAGFDLAEDWRDPKHAPDAQSYVSQERYQFAEADEHMVPIKVIMNGAQAFRFLCNTK